MGESGSMGKEDRDWFRTHRLYPRSPDVPDYDPPPAPIRHGAPRTRRRRPWPLALVVYLMKMVAVMTMMIAVVIGGAWLIVYVQNHY
jgi:hypothetical protein